MKYGSKHEAKKWSLDTLGHGGLVATIPTPFDDNLQIHEKDLRAEVRYVIETKNDAIFVLGNVGEFYSLTQDERKRVAEIVIDEAQGRSPPSSRPPTIARLMSSTSAGTLKRKEPIW
jgi:dihydrodipicolinate synthase/N-acetylneuraminate lyase